MIRYVKIPAGDNFPIKKFRQKYLELTNESVQKNPPTTPDGRAHLFASNRISPNVARTLRSLYPAITISRKPISRKRRKFPEKGARWDGSNMEDMVSLTKNTAPMSVNDAGELIVYNQDGTEDKKILNQWVPEI